VTEALSAVAHSTADLAEYARTVLGDAAPLVDDLSNALGGR
jgi:hypothetical protein